MMLMNGVQSQLSNSLGPMEDSRSTMFRGLIGHWLRLRLNRLQLVQSVSPVCFGKYLFSLECGITVHSWRFYDSTAGKFSHPEIVES